MHGARRRRPATRARTRRRRSRATGRRHAPGAASGRRRSLSVADAGDAVQGTVDVLLVRNTIWSRSTSSRYSSSSANQAPSPCLTGMTRRWPSVQRAVSGVVARSTRMVVSAHTNSSEWFGRSTPGGGRLRTGSGSRCRCRAPVRPLRRSGRRPPSPARSARSLRSGGSHRTRSHQAGRHRRRRSGGRRLRARASIGSAPSAWSAQAASRSSFDPGKTTTATRGRGSVTRPPPPRSRSSRSAGWRAAAGTSARPPRGPAPHPSRRRGGRRRDRFGHRRQRSRVGGATPPTASSLRVEDARLRPDEHGRLHRVTTVGSATYSSKEMPVSRSNAST